MPGVLHPGQVGAREDLSDLIFLYKRETTPYLSSVRKGAPPKAETTEWQADKPAIANKRGKRDGTPAGESSSMTQDRRLIQMYSHWQEQPISAGKKAMALDHVAGVGSGKAIYAKEKAKAMAACKTAVDQILCDYNDCRAESGNVGSETRGAFSYIQIGAQSVLPVDEKYRSDSEMIYSGTLAALTEANFRTMAAHQFTLRDEGTRLRAIVGITLKTHISDWSISANNVSGKTLLRTFDRSQRDKVLSAIVDIIEADGCAYEILPSNNLYWDRSSTTGVMSAASKLAGLLIDDDSCDVGFAQGFQHKMLPDDNSGDAGVIDCIFTHRMTPKVNGKLNPTV